MKKIDAIQILRELDKKGKYVFTKHDMFKLFSNDNPRTLDETLRRLVKTNQIVRASRGIYVNIHAKSFDAYTIEHIAKALRRNEYNYVSLESILSEYGMISQIPINYLTVMTTGRKGTYKTTYGTIEFTHTKRSTINILDHIQTVRERPLRIATKETALRDLKRVGRNLNLVNIEEMDE